MLFENSTIGELAKGRSRKELDAFKDGVLVVAGNMYYDDKISNGEYNDIVGALITIRDILDKAEACEKLADKWAQSHYELPLA